MDLETLTSLSSGARFFRADLHVRSYRHAMRRHLIAKTGNMATMRRRLGH